MHNLDTNADRIIFQFLASPEQSPLILVAGNVWAQTCPDQSKSTKDLLLNMSDSQNTFYSPETLPALWILQKQVFVDIFLSIPKDLYRHQGQITTCMCHLNLVLKSFPHQCHTLSSLQAGTPGISCLNFANQHFLFYNLYSGKDDIL